MWEPQPLTTLRASKACKGENFTFYLYNHLTDGGKVVSLTHRSPFTPREDSWYSFLLDAEGHSGAGRIWSIEKNPPHRNSNPQLSGLQHSASTNYAAVCHPITWLYIYIYCVCVYWFAHLSDSFSLFGNLDVVGFTTTYRPRNFSLCNCL
jgi:hypothetical protein